MNPTLIPLAEYQAHMLTRELVALVEMGLDTAPFIAHAATTWGATEAEAHHILTQIGAPHADRT